MNAQPSPPPLPPSAPPPKRRGRTLLVALGVVVGIVVVSNAVGSKDAPPGTTARTGAGAAAPAAAPGIGDEVRDGSFAFTVTGVETGVESLGEGFLASTPQGSYALVRVTVTNIGDDAALFSDSSQKLLDGQGREFAADTGAAVLSLPGSKVFLNSINPGNAVEGTLVYDLPDGLAPVAIELHDSPFSGGTTVTLTG